MQCLPDAAFLVPEWKQSIRVSTLYLLDTKPYPTTVVINKKTSEKISESDCMSKCVAATHGCNPADN